MLHPKPSRFADSPHLRLQEQALWPPCPPPLPQAQARMYRDATHLYFRFEICEAPHTFRCEVQREGGPVWQDSCVEVFLAHSDASGLYTNIECNSQGICLVQTGAKREGRHTWSPAQSSTIQRRPGPVQSNEHAQCADVRHTWSMELAVPVTVLGWKGDAREYPWRGNLYKCGSLAPAPHYLALFNLSSPGPDFHRPQDFQPLPF